MESTQENTAPRPNNSWGVIISIVLILGIMVGGAYLAFTDRYTGHTETPSGY